MKKPLILVMFLALLITAGCSAKIDLNKPEAPEGKKVDKKTETSINEVNKNNEKVETPNIKETLEATETNAAEVTETNTTIKDEPNSENTGIGLANPASTNCLKLGGKLEIIPNADDSQEGNCTLPSGKVCEEWALFRGECK